jgi:cytochrome c oxidase assembly protein subunit 17
MNCEKYIKVTKDFKCDTKERPDSCKWFDFSVDMCKNLKTYGMIKKELEVEVEKTQKTPVKKICCSCPDTKKIRDACNIESDDCKFFIEAHNLCLVNEGFKLE